MAKPFRLPCVAAVLLAKSGRITSSEIKRMERDGFISKTCAETARGVLIRKVSMNGRRKLGHITDRENFKASTAVVYAKLSCEKKGDAVSDCKRGAQYVMDHLVRIGFKAEAL